MMGRRTRDQGKLFYEFRLEESIPENHLLRRMNVRHRSALETPAAIDVYEVIDAETPERSGG